MQIGSEKSNVITTSSFKYSLKHWSVNDLNRNQSQSLPIKLTFTNQLEHNVIVCSTLTANHRQACSWHRHSTIRTELLPTAPQIPLKYWWFSRELTNWLCFDNVVIVLTNFLLAPAHVKAAQQITGLTDMLWKYCLTRQVYWNKINQLWPNIGTLSWEHSSSEECSFSSSRLSRAAASDASSAEHWDFCTQSSPSTNLAHRQSKVRTRSSSSFWRWWVCCSTDCPLEAAHKFCSYSSFSCWSWLNSAVPTSFIRLQVRRTKIPFSSTIPSDLILSWSRWLLNCATSNRACSDLRADSAPPLQQHFTQDITSSRREAESPRSLTPVWVSAATFE